MIEPTASAALMAKFALPALAGGAGNEPGGESFAEALQRAAQTHGRPAAREAATQLVASALLVPVLEAMYERPRAEPPFAPTAAEKRFAPLLSQHLADRIIGAANFPLVDVILDRLLGPETPAPKAPSESDHVES